MIQEPNETAWQHYQAIDKEARGMQHYLCAEFVALHRAMQTLKQSNGKPIPFGDWVTDAVEFPANMNSGIYCKYRDFIPSLFGLQDSGCLKIVGDLDTEKDWNKITVQITPKGFLATPQEWWDKCSVKFEEIGFDTEKFKAKTVADDPQLLDDEEFLAALEEMMP